MIGLYYLISAMSLPYVWAFLTVMYIYKEIIFFILCKLHDPADITRLKGMDSYFTFAKKTQIVDTIMIINLKSGNVDDFFNLVKKTVKENILDNSALYPKMTSIIQKFMGYSFLKHTNIDVNKCVSLKNAKEFENKSLEDLVNECAKRKLPLEGEFLWELIILEGDTPWKEKNLLEENQIVFLIRFNHLAADGFVLGNFFMHNFADKNIELKKSVEKPIKKPPSEKLRYVKFIKKARLLLIAPGYVIANSLIIKSNVFKTWKAPKISYKKRCFWSTETKTELVEMVKSTRNLVKGTTYKQILFTAISASLECHFQQIPENPKHALLADIQVGSLFENLDTSGGIPDLKNQFSFAVTKLPINFKSTSLLDRLNKIKKQMRKPIALPEFKLNRLIGNTVFDIVPEPISKYLVPKENLSMCLSNLPGYPKITLLNGNEIEKVYFFPSHRDQLGLHFGIMTYDNRIHIGLSVDKATIPCDDTCRKILNGIFDNIRLLNDEVCQRKM